MPTETFTSSGTWTCPNGVYTVRVQMWGAGGKGGTRTSNGTGGGGGGGAYSELTAFPVTPGNNYAYQVGSGLLSVDGGRATFWVNTSTGLAVGGGWVNDNVSTGAAGGAAAACVGDIKYSGGNGADGIAGSYGGGGGEGAAATANGANAVASAGGTGTDGGDGGDGAVAQGDGLPGADPGGGGGGGYRRNNGTRAGGYGNIGRIVLTYEYDSFPASTEIAHAGFAPLVQVQEPATNVSPSAGSASLSGLAPSLIIGVALVTGGISLTGNAPSVGIGITPSTGSVNITPDAPTASRDGLITPSAGGIDLVGYAASLGIEVPVAASSAALTGYEPTVERAGDTGGGYGGLLAPLALNLEPTTGIIPSSGELTFTGYAPSFSWEVPPQTGSLSITGYAPSVLNQIGGGGYGGLLAPLALNLDPQTASVPGAGSLSLTGYAPDVTGVGLGGGGYGGLLAPLALNLSPVTSVGPAPFTGSISFTGYAPAFTTTSGAAGGGLLMALSTLLEYQPQGELTLTGYAPTIYVPAEDLGWDELVSGSATLSGTGSKGATLSDQFYYPTSGALALTGYAPSTFVTVLRLPTTGALAFTGYAPSFSWAMSPTTGALAFTGYAPVTTITGRSVTTDVGSIALTGYAPSAARNEVSLSGLLIARRAFLAVYFDYFGTGEFIAAPVTLESDTSRNSRGEGDLVAGATSLVLRGWDIQPTDSEAWTCQQTDSETWTEVTTPTEEWDG